jgi:undecaprenyl diphosphate synthase
MRTGIFLESQSLQNRKEALKKGNLPAHIAIIMDGNGRWAKKRGLPRIDGHRAGIRTVREIARAAGSIEIEYLTLYTFSSENWNRPPGEVMGLMDLLSETLEKEVPELHKNHVRLKTIGNTSALPHRSREALAKAVEETSKNDGLTLVLALNYGGRDEILHAAVKIAERVKKGLLEPGKITPEIFESALYTVDIPDPDLLIRTSGEYRLSNFLLWQLAYTELWITDTMWPDFSVSDFYDALESYQARERRFGKTSQQISGVAKKIASFLTRGGDR